MGLLNFNIPGTWNPQTQSMAPEAQPAPAMSAPAVQGGLLDSLFAPKAQAPMTNGDRINVLGATLRDIGSGLRGQTPEALDKLQAGGGRVAASGTKASKKAPGEPTDSALLYQTAQKLFPGDPKAQFLFATGNTDFLKSIAESGYGFHDVAGGHSYGNASTGFQIAPELRDHDGVYGTQTADGYTGTGQAAMSYKDKSEQQTAQTGVDRLTAEKQHWIDQGLLDKQRLGIEGGQLGVAQQGLALHQREFGHALNPTAPVVFTAQDYAKLPAGTTYTAPDGSLRTKGGH